MENEITSLYIFDQLEDFIDAEVCLLNQQKNHFLGRDDEGRYRIDVIDAQIRAYRRILKELDKLANEEDYHDE